MEGMSMVTAGVWIVKANEKPRQTKKRGFHWRKFFGSQEEWSWGGREWINSPISMKYLRDEVRKGDTVLAWQVGEGIVGLCKTASGGYEEKKGSGKYDMVNLAASQCLEWTSTPILIGEMKQSPVLGLMEALRTPQGTVFMVTPREWAEIRKLIKDNRLATPAQLRRFAP
jgi:hypothetical protein